MNETPAQSIDSLRFADYNPRILTEQQFTALQNSLARFGDLSGIIKNRHTGNLVGGHQRVRAFQTAGGGTITITHTYSPQTKLGTIAVGYVTLPNSDERYNYREVNWSPEMEKAANIAANKIGGDFNTQQLAEIMYGLTDELRTLTGHSEDEIKKLLDAVAPSSNGEPGESAGSSQELCPHCGQPMP